MISGGIAQSTITVKKTALSGMSNNGQDASRFANLAFGGVFKFGTQSMSSEDEAAYKNFTSILTQSRYITQGKRFQRSSIFFSHNLLN